MTTPPRRPQAMPSDEALVTGLRDGDEARIALLVDAWSAGLLRVAQCLASGEDETTELVRDTWLVVVEQIAAFDESSPFRAWVFQQLVHAARRRGLVRDSAATTESGPTVDPARFQQRGEPYEGHWRESPAPWPSSDDEGIAAEIRTQAASAVERLPGQQRIVLTLRDIEAFDSADVLSIMGIAEADQHVLLHRARAFVRGELETHFASSRIEDANVAEAGRRSRMLRKRLVLLYGAVGLAGIGLWVPVEKLFMSEIGFTPVTVGVMAAAYAAFVPIVEVASGILADRWSRRGVLVIASTALAVSALIGGISTNVGTYIVSAMVLGVYFAMYSGTMESVLYDTVLEETGESTSFQKQLGRVRLVESIALAGSALAGGWIASLTSTRLTYFLTVPFVAASIILYLLFREPHLHKATESTSLQSQITVTYRTLTRRGLVLPIVLVAVLTSLVLQVLFEFGPLWLVALSASAGVFGPFWAGLIGTLGVGGLLAGKLRLDQPIPLAGVIVVMLAASVALIVSSNLLVIAIAQIALALLIVIASIYVTSLLHDAIPSSVRSGVASGVGALSWILFLPFAIGFGLLSEAYGVDSAAWMIAAVVVLVGITLFRLAFRPHPHRAIVALLPEHLDGILDDVTEQRVVDHLSACSGCRTYVDQMRQTIVALGDLPIERLPEPARDSLLAALRFRTSRVSVQPGANPDGLPDRPTLVEEDRA